MSSQVRIIGQAPDGQLSDIKVTLDGEVPHVIIDSMPASGAGLTDAELRASPVVVDLGANNDVTVAALPLPSGAATSALQLPNSHDVTIDNAAGAAAVNIQDGGNVITVDGTVAVSNATFPVTDNAGSLTVDAPVGTPVFVRLSDGAAPIATLPISGAVSGTGTFTTKETRAGTATLSNVNDTASSTTLLASNANRLGAAIHNDSTAILYVKLGTTASLTDYTVRMAAQAHYEVPFAYTGRIDGIWASDASGAARVTELT
jgi:hypothetical protein